MLLQMPVAIANRNWRFTRIATVTSGDNDMCTGSHGATGMISPCRRNATLSYESIHSSNVAVWSIRTQSQPSPTIWSFDIKQYIRQHKRSSIWPLVTTLTQTLPFVKANGSDKLNKRRNTHKRGVIVVKEYAKTKEVRLISHESQLRVIAKSLNPIRINNVSITAK
jgi:hypothetical protein